MHNTDDLGKLTLRITLAVLILFYGVAKLISGPSFIASALAHVGVPQIFAYLVYVGEVIAPILVLLGVWSRAAAALVATNMIVAILLEHTGDLLKLNQYGGWALDLEGFFLSSAIAIILLGAGRYSLGGSSGKYN
ncbi:MAG: DoxX family protein [Gammaproteobacteria bacterium]|nr:DoxX family protein [Gammaproteobacteria bacterium]